MRFFARTSVLAIAAGALAAGVASANTTNSIPYKEPFEETYVTGGASAATGYTNGQYVAGSFGWFGSDVEAYITTNAAVIDKLQNQYFYGYPIATNHTKVLFTQDGTLTNAISTTSGTTVYTDFLIMPSALEDGDRPANDPTAQIMLYVNTNTPHKLVAWISTNYEDRFTSMAGWHVLTNCPAISTGEWTRITIAHNYSDMFGGYMCKFQVNGFAITGDMGWASDGSSHPGPWFAMANLSKDYMSGIEFKGRAYVEDLTVTDTAPTFAARVQVTATANAHGKINGVAGTQNELLPIGLSRTYNVTADQYYHITNITVNGTKLTGPSYPYNNTFVSSSVVTNIAAAGSVAAWFGENFWYNNTPERWLDGYYPGAPDYDAAAQSDTDKDGLKAFEEYIVGTDPTDPNSNLKIIDQGVAAGSNYVQWVFGTNVLPAVKFNTWYATALTSPMSWTFVETVNASPSFTNLWWHMSPPAPPVYYKVSATNSP